MTGRVRPGAIQKSPRIMHPTCAANQWSAAPFHAHLDKVIEDERANLPIPLTDEEIRKSYLLVWLSFAQPAGNA